MLSIFFFFTLKLLFVVSNSISELLYSKKRLLIEYLREYLKKERKPQHLEN